MKEYKKLDRTLNYDREAVEEYAEAANELRAIETRAVELRGILEDNPELSRHVWVDSSNRSIAIHKLEDDHLSNIISMMSGVGRAGASREIKAEAKRRGIDSDPVLSEWAGGGDDED